MGLIAISIAGTAMHLKPSTLRVDNTINQVETADFIIEDKTGVLNPTMHQPIQIDEGAVTLFRGDVDETDCLSHESPFVFGGNSGVARYWKIRGTGLSFLATRFLTGSFSAQVRVPITTVVDALAGILGIAVSSSTTGAITLPNVFLSDNETVASALTRLADLATGISGIQHIWKIAWPGTSFSTVTLYFFPVGTQVATGNVGTGGYNPQASSISVRKTRQQFANRVVLKIDKYLKENLEESFVGSDLFLGTLSVTSPVAGTPTITVAGVDQTLGIKDVDTGKDWYWNVGSNVITQGNATPGGGDVIVIAYSGHDLRSVTSENSGSIGSVGLFAVPVTSGDSGSSFNPAAQATLELAKRNGLTTAVTCRVKAPPGAFAHGQATTVNISYGPNGIINTTCYIRRVTHVDVEGQFCWRELELLTGPMLRGARGFFSGVV